MSPAPASGNSFPKVSCIIPTLNAGSVLGVCLESIRRQDYPQEQIEIIAADGGSTDETLELARRHNAVVIRNERRIAEAGKEAAIAVMTGDYVLFVDADNELSSPDFVRLAVRALEANPGALGLESYYPASPRMGSFCVYLTQTLHIGDPVSWMMSVNPVLQGREGETERWTFPEGSKAFPLGANGFMYRRETLMSVNPGQDFEDTQIALRVADTGRTTWLRLRGRGVHHYVVGGLWDFLRKRRRQTYHFLSRRGRSKGVSWTDMNSRVSPLVALIYCVSVVGPLWHTCRGLCRTRDWHWLWHLVACPASVAGLAWGVITFKIRPRTADAEASLQPKQKIGP